MYITQSKARNLRHLKVTFFQCPFDFSEFREALVQWYNVTGLQIQSWKDADSDLRRSHTHMNQCAHYQTIPPCSYMLWTPSESSPHLLWRVQQYHPSTHHPTWDVKPCDWEDRRVRTNAKLHMCLECIHPHPFAPAQSFQMHKVGLRNTHSQSASPHPTPWNSTVICVQVRKCNEYGNWLNYFIYLLFYYFICNCICNCNLLFRSGPLGFP